MVAGYEESRAELEGRGERRIWRGAKQNQEEITTGTGVVTSTDQSGSQTDPFFSHYVTFWCNIPALRTDQLWYFTAKHLSQPQRQSTHTVRNVTGSKGARLSGAKPLTMVTSHKQKQPILSYLLLEKKNFKNTLKNIKRSNANKKKKKLTKATR